MAAIGKRITDILRNAHMRPHGIGLEHHADLALVNRNQQTFFAREDRLIVDPNLSRVGNFQPRDASQSRRLAAAGRAQQREELPGLYLEADVPNRVDLAFAGNESFVESLYS